MKRISAKTILLALSVFIFSETAIAQHCTEASVQSNDSYKKLQEGSGFAASYSISCITQGVQTTLGIPFRVFNYIANKNSNDTIYKMRIDRVENLPVGTCWATNRADNTFMRGEGGMMQVSGLTNDFTGQYTIDIYFSFDTNNDGEFDRINVGYTKIAKTGKMILRVIAPGGNCERPDYAIVGNIAGLGDVCAQK